MKIVKPTKSRQKRTVSIELRVSTLEKADSAAKKAGLSRQRLINAILDQVLDDKDFVLRMKE